jgi:glycosyltransferase involved in cell wall biosynthesis
VRAPAERPLVSVVVPSYNHAAFVEAAVRSVVAQSYRPVELVVVDDGSSDDSVARLARLRAELAAQLGDRRLAAFEIVEQENRGADRALGRGIESSRGELVAVLNSDDLYHPERLTRLVAALADGAELAFSGVDFVDADGAILPPEHHWPVWYGAGVRLAESLPTAGLALLLWNFTVSSSNFVFRRALFDRLGGFAPLRFTHDWDFLLRAIYHAEPAWVRSPLLSYRVHAENTTEKLRHVLVEESLETLRRYVRLCDGAPSPNPLAPWPANWPAFFPGYAAKHPPAYTEQSLQAVLDSL